MHGFFLPPLGRLEWEVGHTEWVDIDLGRLIGSLWVVHVLKRRSSMPLGLGTLHASGVQLMTEVSNWHDCQSWRGRYWRYPNLGKTAPLTNPY